MIDSDSNGIPDVVEATPPEPNTSDNYLVTKTGYDPSLTDVGMIVRAHKTAIKFLVLRRPGPRRDSSSNSTVKRSD